LKKEEEEDEVADKNAIQTRNLVRFR